MWEWKESHHFYHYTGNQIVYTDFFFLEYDLLRDLTVAWDVCIKKRTNVTFHLLP